MKRFLIPAAALAVILSAYAISRRDHYPSAHEASQACWEWQKEKKAICLRDSPFDQYRNSILDGGRNVVLGVTYPGRKVIRRFKWSNQ